jgi:hypothetical protein
MSSEKQKRESAPPIIPSHKRAEKAQYFLAEVKYEQLTAQNQHLIIPYLSALPFGCCRQCITSMVPRKRS